MHESFLKEHFEIMPKHEKLSPARWSALVAEALMHVGVNSSLFLGWLDETQEVRAGFGTESALC